MKIIALVGPSNCGKTTILNNAYNTIIKNEGISTKKIPVGGDPNDFSDLVTWEGKRIFFFSMGDYSHSVISAAQRYFNQDCDILICACNNHFRKPFKEFKVHDPSPIIIEKDIVANETIRPAIDDKYSQDIINTLQNMTKN